MSEQELNRIIAKNISFYLNKRSKTQVELADYMNVSQATVSNWCKGIKLPRMDKIDRICRFLNINRSDLMNDTSCRTNDDHVLLSDIENLIITRYRESDEITKAMVLRALSIEEVSEGKDQKKRMA